MVTKKLSYLGSLLLTLTFSSSAWADPGALTGIEIDSQGNDFGYWEYLPTAYDEAEDWPVLIFLSGIGENGNGMLDPTECGNGPDTAGEYLCRNLRHGPQHLIWNQLHNGQAGLWNDEERPFIVISPQNPAPLYQMTAYDVDDLDVFLQYLLDTYAADPRRLYLTGMSMGGYSVALSLQSYPDRYSAVSIMPGIAGQDAQMDVCNWTRQNIWAFHGENDGNPFNPGGVVSLVRLFNECPEPHPTGRITMYADAGHNVWTRTIDPPQGMDDPVLTEYTAQGVTVDLDPYDPDLYTWLLWHDKPVVDAGPDLFATTDDPMVQVTATTIDDDPIEYTWTQIAGGALTIAGADAATLELSDYEVGTYTFEVLAVDADHQWDRDEVTIEIALGGGGGTTGGTTGTTGGTTGEPTGTTTDTTGTTSAAATDSGPATSSDSGTDSTGTGSGGSTYGATGTGGGGGATSLDPTADPTGGTPGGTESGSATDAGTEGDTDTAGASDDDAGCGCRSTGGQPFTAPLALLLLGGLRRRRSR